MKLALLLWAITGALSYSPTGQENILSDVLMRDLMSRMGGSGKDFGDISYLDLSDGALPLGPRSISGDIPEEQLFPMDYDALGDINMQPSIRDQEILEHSSLWSNPFADSNNQFSGSGAGMKNRQQDVKSDATLPAYCNPPNPCPVGYTGQNGCIEDFQNTAAFSRHYQASQDCMCDSEHMFSCPNPHLTVSAHEDPDEAYDQVEFTRFIQHSMKMPPSYQSKGYISKKIYPAKSHRYNPFLTGDKLPVAAKKGNKVVL